jgi:thiamine-monophosphate kinase
VAAFLSLALPRRLPQVWVDRFMSGLLRLAGRFKVTLAGGDTSVSPAGILADIVVLGVATGAGAIRRSGAKVGDSIFVSGALGASVAAIREFGKHLRPRPTPSSYPAHFFPEPRLAIGQALARAGTASAMIDLSDGLSTDLAHICQESGVGAEIEAAAIPVANFGRPAQTVAAEFALHGGEDYELLFTAPKSRRVPKQIGGVLITKVGRIIAGRSVLLIDGKMRRVLKPQGWEHFRSGKS